MISGLVIHLDGDPDLAASTCQEIRAIEEIELGDRQQNRLPAVLECATPADSHRMTDALLELPGVAHVDVTFVHLDTETADFETEDVNHA